MGLGFSCQGKVAKSYHSEMNSPEGNPARSYKAVPLDQAATGRCILAQRNLCSFPVPYSFKKQRKKSLKQLISCGCISQECDLPVAALQKRQQKNLM